MKEFVFSKPLGVDSAPFGSSKKEIAPAVAAGLIAGGATIASGIGNLWSQANTNKANREINESQLAFQRGIYYDQKDENRFLVNQAYEREKELNDPVYKKNRLLAAGINPAFAMQSGEFGQNQTVNAGSAPSSPSLPATHYDQPLDFSFMGTGVSNGMANYLAAQKQSNDISALNKELDLKEIETLSKVKSSNINDQKVKAELDSIVEDLKFQKNTSFERERAIRVANDKIRSDQLYTEEMTKAQQFANEIAPEMHENQKRLLASELCKAAAEVAEINSRKDLNQEQKNLVAKQITEQVLRNKDLPKSLHNDNAIKVATYREIKNRASYVQQQTSTEYWNTLDARKSYRSHTGSNRPLSEYVEDAMRNSPKILKK